MATTISVVRKGETIELEMGPFQHPNLARMMELGTEIALSAAGQGVPVVGVAINGFRQGATVLSLIAVATGESGEFLARLATFLERLVASGIPEEPTREH
jgi:hypothetical protein